MQNKQQLFAILGLVILLVLGVVMFAVFRTADSSGGSGDGGSSTIWIIFISQIPIWVAVFAAKQESRKKKKKHDDTAYSSTLEDEIDYQEVVLSPYDGEIISVEELQKQQSS